MAGFFFIFYSKISFTSKCAFSNIFYSFAELSSDHRNNEPKPNSEGNTQMTKSLIASIAFITLAAGLSTAPVQAEEFGKSSSVKVEKASYAVYTPSMAARGERFYVGRD
jgi:bacteriorhodopsin